MLAGLVLRLITNPESRTLAVSGGGCEVVAACQIAIVHAM